MTTQVIFIQLWSCAESVGTDHNVSTSGTVALTLILSVILLRIVFRGLSVPKCGCDAWETISINIEIRVLLTLIPTTDESALWDNNDEHDDDIGRAV